MTNLKVAELTLTYSDNFLSLPQKREFEDFLKTRIESEVLSIKWKQDYLIVVDVGEGSIKSKLRFYAINAYAIVSFIGDFGSGLEYIHNVFEPAFERIQRNIHDSSPLSDHFRSKEVNGGIVQEIIETINRLKELEETYDFTSPKTRKEEIKKLRQKLSNILSVLDKPIREKIIQDLPDSIPKELPRPQPFKSRRIRKKYALPSRDRPKIIKPNK
ncbi:MAG: hypothetical protein GYB31_20800 [Bacteroidetes bacterium]|nr:hypothetical protein [Bacteroidota bacterium]